MGQYCDGLHRALLREWQKIWSTQRCVCVCVFSGFENVQLILNTNEDYIICLKASGEPINDLRSDQIFTN